MKMNRNYMPITELDLPVITDHTDEERPTGAKVLVDGHPAQCFLSSIAWRSVGIIILFDEPHPRFGKEFGTKHYEFLAPGLLGWGHYGESMEVLHVCEQQTD